MILNDNGVIRNTNGQVALKHYQTVPHTLKVGDYEYAFVVRANICLCWIDDEDVNTVLALTKTCCGGNKNTIYRYANESDVRRWTNGGGE